jgi:hypothetical protein
MLRRTTMRRLDVIDGVLFEGDWLPLVGVPVVEAKALLRDAWNISYFADAFVNGRQVPVAHVLCSGDRLEFVQRFGVKAGDDKPIEEAIGEALVAYPELLEMAEKVKAMNLPADRSLDVMIGMVVEWAEQRFGPPGSSMMSVFADIGKRLQRIESILDQGRLTEGQELPALGGSLSGGVVPDGPQPPDRLWLFGKVYKGISRDQWLLLKALWPQRTAEIEDVMEQVYGKNFKQDQEALRSVARRLTERSVRQSCPIEIAVRNGYCTLEVFDEPRMVATDRRTTG